MQMKHHSLEDVSSHLLDIQFAIHCGLDAVPCCNHVKPCAMPLNIGSRYFNIAHHMVQPIQSDTLPL